MNYIGFKALGILNRPKLLLRKTNDNIMVLVTGNKKNVCGSIELLDKWEIWIGESYVLSDLESLRVFLPLTLIFFLCG